MQSEGREVTCANQVKQVQHTRKSKTAYSDVTSEISQLLQAKRVLWWKLGAKRETGLSKFTNSSNGRLCRKLSSETNTWAILRPAGRKTLGLWSMGTEREGGRETEEQGNEIKKKKDMK